jgi:hypothetical protein
VAASRFDVDGNFNAVPRFAFGGLKARRVQGATNQDYVYVLTFDAFDANAGFVVKGTPVNSYQSRIPFVFEAIDEARLPPGLVDPANPGLVVRMHPASSTDAPPLGFEVEISKF